MPGTVFIFKCSNFWRIILETLVMQKVIRKDTFQTRQIENGFFLEGFNTKMRLQGQSFKQEELQSKNKSVKN